MNLWKSLMPHMSPMSWVVMPVVFLGFIFLMLVYENFMYNKFFTYNKFILKSKTNLKWM